MKRLLQNKKLMQGAALLIGAVVSLLMVLPGTAAAACPSGQWPTSAGQCCASSQVVITSTGDVNCTGTAPTCTGGNATGCLFSKYINPFVALLSAAVGIVVVITIIRGAIEYTSSGGDPSKVAAGKTHIINALLGLAAYLTIFAFLQFLIPGGI